VISGEEFVKIFILLFKSIIQHLFYSDQSDRLIKEMRDAALEHLGIDLQMARDPLSIDHFVLTRLGLCRFL